MAHASWMSSHWNFRKKLQLKRILKRILKTTNHFLKMAVPMLATCRLSWLPVLFLLSLLVSVWLCYVKPLVSYDRQTLLDIGASVGYSPSRRFDQWNSHRVLHQILPGAIWSPACCCHRTKRARRRSWRAGTVVKLHELTRDRSLSTLHTILAGTARRPLVWLWCLSVRDPGFKLHRQPRTPEWLQCLGVCGRCHGPPRASTGVHGPPPSTFCHSIAFGDGVTIYIVLLFIYIYLYN